MSSNNGEQPSVARQPVSCFARRALRERLHAVRRQAHRAAKNPDDNVKPIHRLRVASRRAEVALIAFSELLPPKESAWIRRRIRSLRRAAGGPRDLDVFAKKLKKVAGSEGGKQITRILKEVAKLRRDGQKKLERAYAKAKRKRFRRRFRKLVKSLAWRPETPEPTLGDVAQCTMGSLVDKFFSAGSDLANVESLHEMRLCGKQVRYAIEIFADAFDERFHSELYPVFRQLQAQLGQINDHAAFIATLGALPPSLKNKRKVSQRVAQLIADQQVAMQVAGDAFRQSWTPERVADLKSEFDRYLSVPAEQRA